jgi:hypothetical protein
MTTFSTFDSTVNSFYLAFYGRPADPAGLHYWSGQLADANGDLATISAAFSTSEEALVRFGTESATASITSIYQQLFNRAPDAAGLSYWLDMVEHGHASLATVALNILSGAQSTDHTLVDLRQQAMNSFTAQVEASGSEYSGFASVEAARVLVRAVTLDATGADIDALVKAAVSFADTATKTPAVVNAIATGTTLLALYDTARGSGDPVALTQALADTAKAAAGNPVTLDSLLRGGGMDKVLKVMPAAATLQDVVDALAVGGLPAAIEVVYPSTPAAPAFSLALAFQSVTEGLGDTHLDNVTNVGSADVKFSYTGTDLKAGQHFEYSLDGSNWISTGIDVSTATHTVILQGIDLTRGAAAGTASPAGPSLHLMTAIDSQPDLLTTVSLRAVDSNGETTAPVSQQIVYDHAAATPRVILLNDTAGVDNGSHGDMVTRIGTFTLDHVEAGATVEFRPDGLEMRALSSTVGGEWSTQPPVFHEGYNGFSVRQIDAAGNVSDSDHVGITIDTHAPAAPVVALVSDSGIPGDGITNVGKLAIVGLEDDTAGAWEYSVDGGSTWIKGLANDGSGQAVLDLTSQENGVKDVQVRQIDAAGNIGEASNHVAFTLDAAAPDLGLQLAFLRVSEGELDTHHDNVTNVGNASVIFSYDANALGSTQQFEYSTDNGFTWHTEGLVMSAADNSVSVLVDLNEGMPAGQPNLLNLHTLVSDAQPNLITTVSLRTIDAGVASGPLVSQDIVFDHYVATPRVMLENDTFNVNVGSPYDMVTQNSNYKLVGAEVGAAVEYQVDQVLTTTVFNPIWYDGPFGYSGSAPMPQQQQQMIIPGSVWTVDQPVMHEGLNSFTVRQTDSAGNVSDTRHVQITVDTHAPSAPLISLVTDSGTAGDGITNLAQVAIDGLEANATTGWEYSLDGGSNWIFKDMNDGSGHAVLDLTSLDDGPKNVLVHQIDAAGNIGMTSSPLNFVLDTSVNTIAPVFTVTPTETGLRIEGNVAAPIVMNGHPVSTDDATHNAVVGTTTLGAQSVVAFGQVGFVTPSGFVIDQSSPDYRLGTNLEDSLQGQNLWGFDGNDMLQAWGINSHVYGGAGDDTIYAFMGSGPNLIAGGSGADNIVLGNNNMLDTLVYHAGDTLSNTPLSGTGLFMGGSTLGMDMIDGIQAGDVIQLDSGVFTAAPSIQGTYLADASANHVAVVRGAAVGGDFTADHTGTSYIIQWADGVAVNSIEVLGYGSTEPMLNIDALHGTITLVGLPD